MNLCIIGCGNMGLIYSHYFLQQQIVKKEDLLLIEKNEARRKELETKNIATIELPQDKGIENCDVIFLAVKPQDFHDLVPMLKDRLNSECVVISIMAGVTIKHIQEVLNTKQVVRAMPNAPAMHGVGMTVFCCDEQVSELKRKVVTQLLGVTGKIVETKQEDMLNAVTAISGSGPAYFFYLAKQMINQATELGIDEDVAELMVKQTLLGAGVMLDKSDKTCGDLIKTVASKGGTTEAALNVFEENKMPEIISQALQSATNRAAELSGK